MCQVYASQRPESYEPVTRRLRLSGHSTSIRLERGFWCILDGMAAREGMTTPAFISRLYDEVQELQSDSELRLASALRLPDRGPARPGCRLRGGGRIALRNRL